MNLLPKASSVSCSVVWDPGSELPDDRLYTHWTSKTSLSGSKQGWPDSTYKWTSLELHCLYTCSHFHQCWFCKQLKLLISNPQNHLVCKGEKNVCSWTKRLAHYRAFWGSDSLFCWKSWLPCQCQHSKRYLKKKKKALKKRYQWICSLINSGSLRSFLKGTLLYILSMVLD